MIQRQSIVRLNTISRKVLLDGPFSLRLAVLSHGSVRLSLSCDHRLKRLRQVYELAYAWVGAYTASYGILQRVLALSLFVTVTKQ